MDSIKKGKNKVTVSLLAVSSILTLLVFVADLLLPLGYSIWLLFTVLLLLISSVPNRRILIAACSVFTLMIMFGFFYSDNSARPLVSLLNRGGAIITLWIVVFILSRRISTLHLLKHYSHMSEAVLGSINEGLMLATPEGQVIRINRTAQKLYGYKSEEEALRAFSRMQIGWELFDFNGNQVPIEEWPLHKSLRKSFEGEIYRNYRVDNGSCWYGSYSGAPVFNSKGKHCLSAITFRDVSSLVLKELNLKEAVSAAENKASGYEDKASVLDTILECIPDPLFIADNYNHIRFASHSAETFLGLEKERIVSTRSDFRAQDWGIYHPNSFTPAKIEEMPLSKVLNGGQSVTNEEWLVFRAKIRRTALVNAVPLVNNSGEKVGALSIWRNYSERKNKELELEHELRRSKEADYIRKKILESVPFPLALLANDQKVEWTNNAFLQLLQPNNRSFKGKLLSDLLESDEEEMLAFLDQAVATKSPQQIKLQQHKNQSVICWDMSIIPILDTSEKVSNIVISIYVQYRQTRQNIQKTESF